MRFGGNRGNQVSETVAVAIGLMLYWPMLRSPYFQNLLFASVPNAFNGREAYAIANVLILGLALFALIGKRMFLRDKALLRGSMLPTFGGLVTAASAVMLSVSVQQGILLAPALQLAGIALFAVGFSAITLGWFSHLISRRGKCGFIAAASFAASFASVAIEYLPGFAVQASLIALPLATSFLLVVAKRLAKQLSTDAAATSPKPYRASASASPDQASSSIGGIILMATCFCLIASAPSLCLFAPTSEYTPTSETPKTYIFSALVAVAMAGVMSLRKPFPVKQSIILIILSTLLIIDSLALASTDNAMPFAATTHTCLQFALFLSLLSFWRDRPSGELGGAGAFLAITSLLAIVSRYLLPLAFPKSSSESLAAMFGMLSIVILSAAGVGLALSAVLRLPLPHAVPPAPNNFAKNREGIPPVSKDQRHTSVTPPDLVPQTSEATGSDDAVRDWLASDFGLSPREIDTALLVARGYTVHRIAENLCLADGTVQSHMKSIYRKLNVHSKQEVIDLVHARVVNQ